MPLSPRARLCANVALFQLGWFACVLSAARDAAWIAPLAASAVLVWHLTHAEHARRELALAAVVVLVGVVFETMMLRMGVVVAAGTGILPGVPAYWLICLWALFATTFNVSLRWLHPRPALAAAFGAIGGPLAYVGGDQLGALDVNSGDLGLAALGLGWALAMPLLLRVAQRLDGFANP